MLELLAGLFSVGVLTIIFRKSRCYLRRRTDGEHVLPAEWGVGFAEAILVPLTPKTLRHMAEGPWGAAHVRANLPE